MSNLVEVVDGTKKCTGCQEWKPLALFHVDNRQASLCGYKSRCKVCCKDYPSAHKTYYWRNVKPVTVAPRPDGPIDRPGFESALSSHHTGMTGDAAFIQFAAEQGWPIFRGFTGHEPYDYVLDMGDRLLRVEVKATRMARKRSAGDGDVDYIIVTKLKADPNRYDYLFIHTPKGDYWVPVENCPRDTFSTTVNGKSRHDKWEQFRVS